MAGVKGRSGGARPGAGRKPNPPQVIALSMQYDDPLVFLKAVMNDAATDVKVRTDAAKALMPFVHAKKGETGKKDAKLDDAKKVASRFASGRAPLKAVGNG